MSGHLAYMFHGKYLPIITIESPQLYGRFFSCFLPIKKAIESALDNLKDQFYVDFEFEHNVRMDYNFSQNARQIRENIMGEMEERTETFLLMVTWLNRLVSIAFLLLLVK